MAAVIAFGAYEAAIYFGVGGALGALGAHLLNKFRSEPKAADCQKMADEIKALREELRKLQKKEEKQSRFDEFLDAIKIVMKELNKNVEKLPYAQIGFQGKVSVGKSTVVNALFGSKVAATGRRVTTKKPTLIEGGLQLRRKTLVWDLPGDDSNFSYMDLECVLLVNKLDVVIVVYDSTLDYANQVVRIALALEKKVILLRNKLDIDDEDDDEDGDDWRKDIAKDKAELDEQLGPGYGIKIFGVSAKNRFKSSELPLYEWNDFVRELQRLC
mmetsp:Transcript_21550/g.49739  ORF Transcript_21550/g.49739 Transcript_21550/m.49739 type:complete len:271 (-) Transcript_21550:335-1147(-)